MKLYRGVGSNYSDGNNEGFLWVSESEDLAKNYSSDGEVEEYEYPINDMKILDFTYKGNPKVEAQNITNGFILPIVKKEYKSGNITDLDDILDRVDTIEMLMGDEVEYAHTKLNKPQVNKKLALLLSELDYDAISLIENGIKTYGIIKSTIDESIQKYVELLDSEILSSYSVSRLTDVITELVLDKLNEPN